MSKVEYNNFSINYVECPELIEDPPYKRTSSGKIWEKKLYDRYKKICNKSNTALDIGGYIGSHALPMAHYAKNVYCFEPTPYLYNTIKSNIKLNKIENVILLAMAAFNKDDQVNIDARLNGTSRIHYNKIKGELTEVPCHKIDTLLPDVNDCNFIKIDVEGAEFDVLEGAHNFIKRNKPIIFIEVFKTKTKREKLEKWCQVMSYSFKHLGGDDFALSPSP
jgi:FkbM family methyltransferase